MFSSPANKCYVLNQLSSNFVGNIDCDQQVNLIVLYASRFPNILSLLRDSFATMILRWFFVLLEKVRPE